jgi:SNF2 family DNA or RNA helicase
LKYRNKKSFANIYIACDHPQLILKSINNDKDVLDIVSDINNNNNNNCNSSPAIPTTDTSLMWSKSSCELCGKSIEASSSTFCTNCQSTILSPSLNQQQGLFKTSTKVRKMLEILEETRENNPGEKTIIFSQFTSMLDLMEGPLKKHGFKVCRCKALFFLKKKNLSISSLLIVFVFV